MKSTEILERIQIQHLLTSLAVDSLAKTSALLEKVSELSVKEVAYGLKCTELYGKLDLKHHHWKQSNAPYSGIWTGLMRPFRNRVWCRMAMFIRHRLWYTTGSGAIILYCLLLWSQRQEEHPRIDISGALPIGAIYTSISGMENKTVNTLTPICWKV